MFTTQTVLIISSIFSIIVIYKISNISIEKAIDIIKKSKS
jgi:diacylglycerol kinase